MNINSETRVHCVTHTDEDGIFSGLIVRKRFPNAVCFQTNYDLPIDPKWFDCDVLFLTDFSFPIEVMKQLDANPKLTFIWIDHHMINTELGDWCPKGLRRQDVAACHLVWEYLFPTTPVPRVVKLISDYDIWKWQDNPDALLFQNAIRCRDLPLNGKNTLDYFEQLINDDKMLDRMIANGRAIEDYYVFQRKMLCEDYVFETELAGYKALACNNKATNSQLFDPLNDKYKDWPLRITFAWYPKISGYRVTVYSMVPEQVSAHKICREFGGGGHDGAAGFRSVVGLPFKLPAESSKKTPLDDFEECWHALSFRHFVRANVVAGSSVMTNALAYSAVLNNQHVTLINNPFGYVETIDILNVADINSIVGFYSLMNNGKYLYRLYSTDPSITLREISRRFPESIILDESVAWLSSAIPQPAK